MLIHNTISIDSVIVRNNSLFASEIGDELVCLDEISGNYYGLNCTGKFIWELLKQPTTVRCVIDQMRVEYPTIISLHEDILTYLNALYDSNDKTRLIEIVE